MSKQVEVYDDVCAICQGTWCQSEVEPQCLLPCKHMFGLSCFKKLPKTQCPSCRAPFVWDLNVNLSFEAKQEEETPETDAEDMIESLFHLIAGRQIVDQVLSGRHEQDTPRFRMLPRFTTWSRGQQVQQRRPRGQRRTRPNRRRYPSPQEQSNSSAVSIVTPPLDSREEDNSPSPPEHPNLFRQ